VRKTTRRVPPFGRGRAIDRVGVPRGRQVKGVLSSRLRKARKQEKGSVRGALKGALSLVFDLFSLQGDRIPSPILQRKWGGGSVT